MKPDRKLAPEDILLDLMPTEKLRELQKHVLARLQQQGVSVPIMPAEGIPVEIFADKCSPAEALVKYLKENKEMNFHEIGKSVARDERGIWGSYQRSKKKMSEGFSITDSALYLPLDIFKDRSKSILASTVTYLHEEQQMKFSQIAKLLNKKYSTVYTTYARGKK